jgi:hypothetical protein
MSLLLLLPGGSGGSLPSYVDASPLPYSRPVTQAEFNVGNEFWFRVVVIAPITIEFSVTGGGTFTPVKTIYQSDATTVFVSAVTGTTVQSVAFTTPGAYFIKITRSGGGASDFDFEFAAAVSSGGSGGGGGGGGTGTGHTKFYLLNAPAPYTPTSWRGAWDKDGINTWACDVHKFGDNEVVATNSKSTATTPYKLGIIRLVSPRLAPQTISGTLDFLINMNEGSASADLYTRLHVYVVNATTNAVLGTLLNGYQETSGGGATEWPTVGGGAFALQSAQTLSSVTVPNDANVYRLVFELGAQSEAAAFGGGGHPLRRAWRV